MCFFSPNKVKADHADRTKFNYHHEETGSLSQIQLINDDALFVLYMQKQ